MAKPRKPKLTKNQQAYADELKRVKRRVKTLEKKGYIFTDKSFLETPKRIGKKQIENLKTYTTTKLYSISRYFDPIKQQYISGAEEQKLVRSRASKKAAQARKAKKKKPWSGEADSDGSPPNEGYGIIANLYYMIANWRPDPRWRDKFARIKENDKNILKSILDGIQGEIGLYQMAKNAEKHAGEIKDLAWAILYGESGDKRDEGTQADLITISTLLRGRALTPDEAKDIQDMVDQEAYENEV